MSYPQNLKYTQTHEWVKIDGDVVTVGITSFAQEQLGDVVHVELPEVGAEVGQGDSVSEIESVKAVSDVYAPCGGEVVAVNEDLDGDEQQVNQDPYGAGWLFRVRAADVGDLEGLLNATAYAAHVAASEH